MQELVAGVNDAGQRLDKFITKKYKNMPMSMMYKLIRKKKITVNRKRVKENYIVEQGDVILIFAPDDLLTSEKKKPVVAVNKLVVAYEDDNIIIADKEQGLLVHSDEENGEDTLIDRIIAYLIEKNEYDPEIENSFVPALCNRIDRNTSGLVIAAKNAQALREMNEIIKKRQVTKKYLAAVHGVPSQKEGTIKLLLEKDSDNNIVKVRDNGGKNVKQSVTKYKTVSVSKDKSLSLVEIELVTGRTHQIRASFAHIGNPLLGDGKYAVNKKDRAMGYSSQALCSYSLKFEDLKEYPTLSYLEGKTVFAKKPDFLKLF